MAAGIKKERQKGMKIQKTPAIFSNPSFYIRFPNINTTKTWIADHLYNSRVWLVLLF